jgi:hypothetical protein
MAPMGEPISSTTTREIRDAKHAARKGDDAATMQFLLAAVESLAEDVRREVRRLQSRVRNV